MGQPCGCTSATQCLTPLYFLVIPSACFTPASFLRASPNKLLRALFHGETIRVHKTNWLLQDQGLHLSRSQECFIQDACGRSHIKFLVLLTSAITSHPHKYGEELLKAGAATALHSYLIVHSSFQTKPSRLVIIRNRTQSNGNNMFSQSHERSQTCQASHFT